MNGIDISGHQPNIDLAKVPCDFVIIKATQGTSFISKAWQRQTAQAVSLGKLIGLYHYASKGGAINEANHFLETVTDYIGKAILVLDWEGQDNVNFGNPDYAMDFLNYVKKKTGITPFIYMSKSVCRQYKWDSYFPLWCAQYANDKKTGYQDKPWTDTKGFGAWNDCKIFQYSSKGRLQGYNADLDLDISYMTPNEWQAWAGYTLPTDVKPTLRKGDRNEYVRSWQTLLNLNGYDCGITDGIFGDKTEKAIIKWQQDHGMEAGYIGEQTWATLPV